MIKHIFLSCIFFFVASARMENKLRVPHPDAVSPVFVQALNVALKHQDHAFIAAIFKHLTTKQAIALVHTKDTHGVAPVDVVPFELLAKYIPRRQ